MTWKERTIQFILLWEMVVERIAKGAVRIIHE